MGLRPATSRAPWSGGRPLMPSSVFRSLELLCSLCLLQPSLSPSTRPLSPQGARAWCPPKIPPTRRPAERAFWVKGERPD